MAAKFTIIPKYDSWALSQGELQRYRWKLNDSTGIELISTGFDFISFDHARSHIALVKRAAGKFTKVEVEI